jgi:hypothetical protein
MDAEHAAEEYAATAESLSLIHQALVDGLARKDEAWRGLNGSAGQAWCWSAWRLSWALAMLVLWQVRMIYRLGRRLDEERRMKRYNHLLPWSDSYVPPPFDRN